MDRLIGIELSGLTKLDQLELENLPELKQAKFEQQKTPAGQLGYVPLLSMTVDVPVSLIGAIGAGLALWLAKRRTRDTVEVSLSTTKSDGTKSELKIKGERTVSEGLESEIVGLAKQLLDNN
jgi:hypothetical protein